MREKVIKVFSSRLAKDSLFQFILNFIGAALSFLQLPLLLKIMGGQGFGELVIIQTIVNIFSAFTLIQFFQGMMKYAPNASDAEAKMSSMVRIGLINEFISIIIGLGLVVCFQKLLNEKFPNICTLDKSLILFIAFTTSLAAGQTIPTLLRLIGKYQYVAWWSAFCSILRFILLFILPVLKVSAGIVVITSFVVPEVIRYLLLLLLVPGKILFAKRKTVSQFREMIKFSVIITIQEWFDLPVKQFDKLILSVFVQPVYVGTYQILRRIGSMMAMVVTPFSTSFFHEFSERINANNANSALLLFKKSIYLFSAISVVVAAVLILLRPFWVSRLFVNIEIDQLLIISIIIIYIIVNSFNSIHSLLYVLGGIRESLLITLITNGVFFLAAFYLGYLFRTGGLITAFALQVVLAIVFKSIVINKKMIIINLQKRI